MNFHEQAVKADKDARREEEEKLKKKYPYNNEVFLRVTNHTGQVEKNLLGPAGNV